MDSNRFTVLLVVLLCAIGHLQGKPTSSLSNNLNDNIKYLLKLIDIENEYVRFLSYMKIYPPEDDRMKSLYNDLFSYDSFISDLTSVYANHYTPTEIVELVSFYSSPLGKKMNAVTQMLDKEMENVMLDKISDYIFTLSENGFDVSLPQIPH